MIISKQKQFNDILNFLAEENIFLIGCGKCAKKMHTGGEQEVLEMKRKLSSAGKNITGYTVLSTACSIDSWNEVLLRNPDINRSDAILVMSCGGGVSLISDASHMQVYPALDTESLGGVFCNEVVSDLCAMCGDCTISLYGGICPVIRCPKSLSNGPCGGSFDGKCEVDERPCAWDLIFERLKVLGKLENLENILPPKDYRKIIKGRKM